MMTQERFGDPESRRTADVLSRFNAAFQRRDPAALEELIADDCVIENSQPAPDGSRHQGKAACLRLWSGIATNPSLTFDTEDIFASGKRGEIRWRLKWGPDHADSVRGVNLMRVRGGRIVEALGYVKGA